MAVEKPVTPNRPKAGFGCMAKNLENVDSMILRSSSLWLATADA